MILFDDISDKNFLFTQYNILTKSPPGNNKQSINTSETIENKSAAELFTNYEKVNEENYFFSEFEKYEKKQIKLISTNDNLSSGKNELIKGYFKLKFLSEKIKQNNYISFNKDEELPKNISIKSSSNYNYFIDEITMNHILNGNLSPFDKMNLQQIL